MKKTTILCCSFASLYLFFAIGCANPALNSGSPAENNPEKERVEALEKSEFVNGINVRFLEEQGMTEDEFYEYVARDVPEEEGGLPISSSNVNIASNELAKIFIDIIDNPKKYFDVKFDVQKKQLDFGLGKEKLGNAVSKIQPIYLIHEKSKKVLIERISVNDITNNYINLRVDVRAKKYIKIWKWIKIMDSKGTFSARIQIGVDKRANKIKFTKIGKVHIHSLRLGPLEKGLAALLGGIISDPTTWILDHFFGIMDKVKEHINKAKNFMYDDKTLLEIDMNKRIPATVLTFDKAYTSGGYLYFRFNLNFINDRVFQALAALGYDLSPKVTINGPQKVVAPGSSSFSVTAVDYKGSPSGTFTYEWYYKVNNSKWIKLRSTSNRASIRLHQSILRRQGRVWVAPVTIRVVATDSKGNKGTGIRTIYAFASWTFPGR